MKPHPPWLEQFQRNMTAILEQPLGLLSGRLQADPRRWPVEAIQGLGASLEGTRLVTGMSLYQEQRWVRYFSTLQREFPLFARLIGLWSFNRLAEAYLLRHPPASYDLARIADRFAEFLLSSQGLTLAEPLFEALQWDEAYRRCLAAPEEEDWQAQDLLNLQLRPKASLQLVEEHWPLLALRHHLKDSVDEAPLALPPRLEHKQAWALQQQGGQLRTVALEPLQFKLYQLLLLQPLDQALAQLARDLDRSSQLILASHLKDWMQLTRRLGFWKADA